MIIRFQRFRGFDMLKEEKNMISGEQTTSTSHEREKEAGKEACHFFALTQNTEGLFTVVLWYTTLERAVL